MSLDYFYKSRFEISKLLKELSDLSVEYRDCDYYYDGNKETIKRLSEFLDDEHISMLKDKFDERYFEAEKYINDNIGVFKENKFVFLSPKEISDAFNQGNISSTTMNILFHILETLNNGFDPKSSEYIIKSFKSVSSVLKADNSFLEILLKEYEKILGEEQKKEKEKERIKKEACNKIIDTRSKANEEIYKLIDSLDIDKYISFDEEFLSNWIEIAYQILNGTVNYKRLVSQSKEINKDIFRELKINGSTILRRYLSKSQRTVFRPFSKAHISYIGIPKITFDDLESDEKLVDALVDNYLHQNTFQLGSTIYTNSRFGKTFFDENPYIEMFLLEIIKYMILNGVERLEDLDDAEICNCLCKIIEKKVVNTNELSYVDNERMLKSLELAYKNIENNSRKYNDADVTERYQRFKMVDKYIYDYFSDITKPFARTRK